MGTMLESRDGFDASMVFQSESDSELLHFRKVRLKSRTFFEHEDNFAK